MSDNNSNILDRLENNRESNELQAWLNFAEEKIKPLSWEQLVDLIREISLALYLPTSPEKKIAYLQLRELVLNYKAQKGQHENKNKIEEMRGTINNINEDKTRSALESRLNELEKAVRRTHEQTMTIVADDTKLRIEEVKIKVAAEEAAAERRSKMMRSFFERESVATLVGGIILIALTLSLLIAMFKHIETSGIINNAFLILLGFFFGQSKKSNEQ